MKKLITLLFLGWLLSFNATAQVTFNAVPSTTSADPGTTVYVDIEVDNFTDIVSFQFDLTWDNTILEFQNIVTHDNICNLGGCFSYPNDFGPATISNFFTALYLDPNIGTSNAIPNTLSNGTSIVTAEFLVVGNSGSSSLNFNAVAAVAFTNGNEVELTTSNGLLAFNNSSISVNNVGGGCIGTGDVTFTASSGSGDTGTTGTVQVTVDNFDGIEGFGIDINWNPSVISVSGVDNINLPGLLSIANFATQDLANGNLYISCNTAIGVDACDGQVIFELPYTIVGAGGTSTGVDFTGNIEVIRNSLLVPFVINNGSVTATGTGGGTLTGVTFQAGTETGYNNTQVCVPFTVAGFTGVEAFQYEMTWNPAIMTYNSILDGNGQALFPIGAGNPLSLLSTGGAPNFGTTNTSNGTLSVAWDNSSGVTLDNQTSIYEVCFDIIGSVGQSTPINFGGVIEVADGNGITDFNGVAGSVTVTEPFINGLNLEWDCCEKAQIGDSVCIDVRVVEGFTDILSLQYGMTWDPAVLSYKAIFDNNGVLLSKCTPGTGVVGPPLVPCVPNPFNPLLLKTSDFTLAAPGALRLLWIDPLIQGVSLAPETSLYQVCFDVIGNAGDNTTLDVLVSAAGSTVEVANSVGGGTAISYLGTSCTTTVVNPPSFSSADTNPLCVGSSDGTIDITITDGVMGWTYEWSNSETTEDITGLSAGDYTVTVTDCTGNTFTESYTLVDPSPIEITATITDESGFGNDGAIALNVTGGTGTYTTYTWSPNAGTTGTITGLAADNYEVTVEDSNGCTAMASFTVGEICASTTINITATITDESGFGNDGAIDISLTGGATPYASFLWNNGATTQNISGLTTGTYTVVATDANGCTGSQSFTLGDACNATNITFTGNITDVSGAGNDGAIDITLAGGATPYSAFLWSNGATTQNLSGVPTGTYTVIATDANGCTGTQNFTIGNLCLSTNITFTGNITDVSGAGNDGAIDITLAGGATPYSAFLWSNGATTQNLSGVPTGTYTVVATDANGCTGSSQDFIVGNACTPITITANITHESSAGNDGAINASSTGGTAPYSYNWNPATGTTTGNPTGLVAGNYNVTVTDTNGCTDTNSFTVEAFNCPTITVTASGTNVTCAGGNNGTATANATGGTSPYTYNWGANQNALTAGTYTVTATDADGCFATTTVTINDGVTIGMNLISQNDLNCFGDNSGSITIQGTGGTAPYFVNWGLGLSGLTITNLPQGTYTPTITDANNCSTVGNTITLSQPSDISISGTATNVSCNGENDGAINLNISGGAGGYSVTWSPSGNGNNLTAGTYTPTVTDANGCQKIGNPITVTEPSPLSVTSNITNASCFGNCDGTISLNISGGTSGYTVNWSNGSTGTTVSDLCAGTISVTVADANGCTFSDIYTITQPVSFGLQFFVTPETTAGGDGAIDLTVTPAGNYSYLWSNGATTEDINNLVTDAYSVTVTDNISGCTATGVTAITNGLGIQTATVTDVTCNNGDDGAIDIVTVGGDAPYNWLWSSNTNNAQTESISNLTAGTYTLTITDDMGVTLTQTYTIEEPDAITITSFNIINEVGSCDGSINIEVAGGTPGYTYLWSNGATSQDITDLCEGLYTVEITDNTVGGTCVITSQIFEVEASTPQIGDFTIDDASCNGGCDGKICVEIVGGNAPYTVSLLGTATQTITSETPNVCFAGLCPGDYFVQTEDAMGLTFVSEPYTVGEPTAIEISNVVITNQSPTTCNGSINITPTGGTPSYSYLWSNGSTDQDPTDLCMGNYNVTITDANGCIFTSPEYFVGKEVEELVIEFIITPVLCFGDATGGICATVTGGVPPYNYDWSNGTTTSCIESQLAGNYDLMVTDAVGTQVFSGSINIPQPAAILEIASITVFQPSVENCADGAVEITVTGGTAGYEYIWEDENGSTIATTQNINNLTGGNYYLTVTDANDCVTTAEASLPGCELNLAMEVSQITCSDECDGSISVNSTTGTQPFTYLWSTDETTPLIRDLCEGTYTVTVTDNNGVQKITSIEIINPDPIQVTVTTSPGRADAIVIGGTAPYSYQWDQVITTNPFIDSLDGGVIHRLMVTDANGCTAMTDFVSDYDAGCLTARSIISPNNDGKNDVFYVNCLENQDVRVTIFNRWGQLVYENEVYDNTWMGTDKKGQNLPQDGYFYILEYNDGSTRKTIKGALSIIR